MKTLTRALFSLALLLLATLPTFAITPPVDPLEPAADDPTYVAGKKALDDQRWRDSILEFDKIIKARAKRADGAYYWKAYALNKMHRGAEAATTCEALRAKFPKSTWNKDCAALAIDSAVIAGDTSFFNADTRPHVNVRVHPRIHVRYNDDEDNDAGNPEADMKVLALNSLLQQNPNAALPKLRAILASDAGTGLKKHVIFVLAQSKNPEASKIIDDAIRGKMDDPALQRQAILMNGIFHRSASNPTLVDVYKSTGDDGVKEAIISSLFIAHDATSMVSIARSEKDLERKRDIVSQLALMHDKAAQDYMLEILK